MIAALKDFHTIDDLLNESLLEASISSILSSTSDSPSTSTDSSLLSQAHEACSTANSLATQGHNLINNMKSCLDKLDKTLSLDANGVSEKQNTQEHIDKLNILIDFSRILDNPELNLPKASEVLPLVEKVDLPEAKVLKDRFLTLSRQHCELLITQVRSSINFDWNFDCLSVCIADSFFEKYSLLSSYYEISKFKYEITHSLVEFGKLLLQNPVEFQSNSIIIDKESSSVQPLSQKFRNFLDFITEHLGSDIADSVSNSLINQSLLISNQIVSARFLMTHQCQSIDSLVDVSNYGNSYPCFTIKLIVELLPHDSQSLSVQDLPVLTYIFDPRHCPFLKRSNIKNLTGFCVWYSVLLYLQSFLIDNLMDSTLEVNSLLNNIIKSLQIFEKCLLNTCGDLFFQNPKFRP
ncbi:hypothetical protein P9112_009131 [Eukaryota sp. TZLM1-RC]